MQYKCIKKEEWDNILNRLLLSYTIFANIENDSGLDYELLSDQEISRVSYNKPKPSTSLKNFFLPVRENVSHEREIDSPRIILGVPNCDVEGLLLLDEIYLDNEFSDPFYMSRRENTILISSDCTSISEHCHCMTYGIKPYSERTADIAVLHINDTMVLRILTPKGEKLINNTSAAIADADPEILAEAARILGITETLLTGSNSGIPGYKETANLVYDADTEIWERYSSRCVSCGACVSICPTCTCFLLIDRPQFEKVKQMDGCQFPGFARVAGGEDPLNELHNRFRNRYMCKYFWKQKKFSATACTGCGRCIEACIGGINKNELFVELANRKGNALHQEHI